MAITLPLETRLIYDAILDSFKLIYYSLHHKKVIKLTLFGNILIISCFVLPIIL